MALLRVLLGFANAPDHELEETAGHVLASLYGNPVFPNPPVSTLDLQAGLKTLLTPSPRRRKPARRPLPRRTRRATP